MTTAVSNPASFSSVRSACSAEGLGSSTSFSAYTRGGGIVPSTASAGISTTASGLRLSQFSGVSITNFNLTSPTPGLSYQQSAISPSSATITLKVGNDGYVQRNGVDTTAYGSPTGTNIAAGKYWKWTLSSGTAPGGTAGGLAGTWILCSDAKTLSLSQTGIGTKTCTLSVQFANDSGGGGATTAGSWTLTADVST